MLLSAGLGCTSSHGSQVGAPGAEDAAADTGASAKDASDAPGDAGDAGADVVATTDTTATDTMATDLAADAMSVPAPFSVPRTGLATCFDENGVAISCAGTGQDGDLQKGEAWPSPRFTNQGDGTTTDNLTGLTWLTDGNCIASRYPSFDRDAASSVAGDGKVLWQHALDFASGLRAGTYPDCAAGRGDWRLPNVIELGSLFNAGAGDNATWLLGQGLTNVKTDAYWTSSAQTSQAINAWSVSGSTGLLGGWKKTLDVCHAWFVRGNARLPRTGIATCWNDGGVVVPCAGTGQDGDLQGGISWPTPRFADNGNGTVTDGLTGLSWLRDANCIASKHPAFDVDGAADGQVSWKSALGFVGGINAGTFAACGAGFMDWRLPNRAEMLSLIDWSRSSPALSLGHPFQNAPSGGYYWTSTASTLPGSTNRSWRTYLFSGFTELQSKMGSQGSVWPVRGGR